jgi:ubiquitin-protein ligase
MMKEIQEKRIENEISLLNSINKSIRLKKFNKDEYYIDITIPVQIQTDEETFSNTEVVFLIHLPHNYPINPPKLYCKTPFSFPHICDGRDIVEDVLGQNWVSSLKIFDIVEKLPNFTQEFYKNLQQGVLVLVGSYYLGERYDLSFLESLPICIHTFFNTY